MPGAPDPQYVRARTALLDAADALAVREAGPSADQQSIPASLCRAPLAAIR